MGARSRQRAGNGGRGKRKKRRLCRQQVIRPDPGRMTLTLESIRAAQCRPQWSISNSPRTVPRCSFSCVQSTSRSFSYTSRSPCCPWEADGVGVLHHDAPSAGIPIACHTVPQSTSHTQVGVRSLSNLTSLVWLAVLTIAHGPSTSRYAQAASRTQFSIFPKSQLFLRSAGRIIRLSCRDLVIHLAIQS